MSNEMNEHIREEKALDALIVAAFKEDTCEASEKEIEQFRQALTAEDKAALDAAGSDFLKSLFAGESKKRKARVVRGEMATAMNRSDEDQPPTEKAKEEMERKIREAEERRVQDDVNPQG